MADAPSSPELRKVNSALRRVMKPMLRFIPSQRVINWMGHQAKPPTGPEYTKARGSWIALEQGSRRLDAFEAVPNEQTHPKCAIILFHGGAYATMSAHTHAPHASRLAGATGLRVICPDYRIAIDAPYPAALDDAETSYDALLAHGTLPEHLVLCGDSAGGGLMFALLLRLKAKGKPLPRCCVSQSPWVDLSLSMPSVESNAAADVLLSRAWLERAARLYAGGADRSMPELSPLKGDLSGLPAQLVLYSQVELFRDECAALVERLTASGVPTEAITHPEAPHAWPIAAAETPEAEAAYQDIARFLHRQLEQGA